MKTILVCALLSSVSLTDAYGFSPEVKSKTGDRETVTYTRTQGQSLKTFVSPTQNIATNNAYKKNAQVKTVSSGSKENSTSKRQVEINESQRMQHHLKNKNVSEPYNNKKHRHLHQIENQTKLREMQQNQQQQHRQDQHRHNEHQQQIQQQHIFNQNNHFVAPVTKKQHQQHTLPEINHQQKHTEQILNQNKLKHKTQAQQHLQQQHLNQQRSQNQIILERQIQQPRFQIPQFPQQQTLMQQQSLSANTDQRNRASVQQITPQHMFVPINVLSLVHGEGLLSNKIIVVNPMANDSNLQISGVHNRVKTRKTFPTVSPIPSTTTQSTSKPASMTEHICTTVPSTATPATTPSPPESTTTIYMETMKHTFYERTLVQQQLEIRKLQLEIRALQREERNSQPEREMDDVPANNRMKFRSGPRRMPFPFIS